MKSQKKGLETISTQERSRRYFAPDVRKSIVKEIDEGLSKSEAARKYDVSETSIYKWYRLYSTHYQKLLVTVVEHSSASNQLMQKEAELQKTYALLGRLKAENMYLNTLIETANAELGYDLKKNLGTKPSAASETKKSQ